MIPESTEPGTLVTSSLERVRDMILLYHGPGFVPSTFRATVIFIPAFLRTHWTVGACSDCWNRDKWDLKNNRPAPFRKLRI